MRKEEIYVVIDSEEKRDRAIQILTDACEPIWNHDTAMEFDSDYNLLSLNLRDRDWLIDSVSSGETEITLDQLEGILPPKKESVEQKAKEMIEQFKPFAYPFAGGSGFMTGDRCEETILSGGKELASIAAQTVADNIGQDHPKWSFWVGVVDAIKNYKVIDPNQTELELGK